MNEVIVTPGAFYVVPGEKPLAHYFVEGEVVSLCKAARRKASHKKWHPATATGCGGRVHVPAASPVCRTCHQLNFDRRPL